MWAGVEALYERADGGSKRFGSVELVRSPGAVDDLVQVGSLGGAEPQCAGERVEDLTGGAHIAALLKEGVVGRRDRGEHRDFLPTQAGRAAPGAHGQPDIRGGQALAARAQEVPKLAPAHVRG